MASILITETGAVIANANTYITLAEANTYHTLYGNTNWQGTDAEKEQALVLACQSLDNLYGPRYLSGLLPNSTQALLFPRMYFVDNNGIIVNQNQIPKSIKNAQAELALKALLNENMFPEENTNAGVASESVKVGEITTSTSYARRPETSSFDGYKKIDTLLYPVLRFKHQPIKLSR